MWEVDYKEGWAPNNWCFWTVVLEKTLESPLDCKEIQPVHPKGNQSWIFIGRTDTEAETPILGPLMRRSDSFEKTLMLGKIEGRRRRAWKRMRWLDGITNSWTWVWVNSVSWWWTGRPGVLQFMGSQRVRHDWATELTEIPNTHTQIYMVFDNLWIILIFLCLPFTHSHTQQLIWRICLWYSTSGNMVYKQNILKDSNLKDVFRRKPTNCCAQVRWREREQEWGRERGINLRRDGRLWQGRGVDKQQSLYFLITRTWDPQHYRGP